MPFLYYDHYCCRRSQKNSNFDIETIRKFINQHKDLIASEHEQFPLNLIDFPNSIEKLHDLSPECISEQILNLQAQLINTVSNSPHINQADKIRIIKMAVKDPQKSCYIILAVLSWVFAIAGFLALPEVFRLMPAGVMRNDDPMTRLMLYLMQFLLVLLIPTALTSISNKLHEWHDKQNRNISNDQEKFELWLCGLKKQIDFSTQLPPTVVNLNEETDDLELDSSQGKVAPRLS